VQIIKCKKAEEKGPIFLISSVPVFTIFGRYSLIQQHSSGSLFLNYEYTTL